MDDRKVTANEIPKCGLPNWPKSDLLTQKNQSFGCPVPDPIESASLDTLPDDLNICFEKLESRGRVLVIVLSKEIPEKLIRIIKKQTGIAFCGTTISYTVYIHVYSVFFFLRNLSTK